MGRQRLPSPGQDMADFKVSFTLSERKMKTITHFYICIRLNNVLDSVGRKDQVLDWIRQS